MGIALIAGAGMAGRACALTLRRVGWDGEIVLVGDEVTHPYDRPPLSKSVIVGTADMDKVVKPAPETYAQDRIDLRLGTRVEAVDAAARTATLSDGTSVAWDAFVLATGCAPRQLPIPGLERAHRITRMDEALALQALLAEGPQRLAIIGGGFIGMEAATAAVAHGHTATVLEAAPEPMARPLGREVAAHVLRWAEARGVAVRAGVGVDAGLCTGVEGVWASGDIAAFPSPWADEERIRVEHAAVAIGHGQVAAERIALGEGLYEDLPTFWSDQGDLTLNVVGVPRPDDEIVWRGDTETPACTAFYVRDGRMRAAMSVGDMKTLRGVRKLFAAGVEPPPAVLADPDADLAALAAEG